MSPLGNLYGMDVFVVNLLRDDEVIVFNAGSHTKLVRLRSKDFERLVRPKIADCRPGWIEPGGELNRSLAESCPRASNS